eukprot:c175_g1_i1.p1 GENE.c175_g1_i1~~c175_g1_i1.p1  ORF type:complete len:195 (-),score=16.37 c175_g1_i1:957-1541(-)
MCARQRDGGSLSPMRLIVTLLVDFSRLQYLMGRPASGAVACSWRLNACRHLLLLKPHLTLDDIHPRYLKRYSSGEFQVACVVGYCDVLLTSEQLVALTAAVELQPGATSFSPPTVDDEPPACALQDGEQNSIPERDFFVRSMRECAELVALADKSQQGRELFAQFIRDFHDRLDQIPIDVCTVTESRVRGWWEK